MKVFENIPQRILTAFNALHGTALTLDQVEFKNPRPVKSLTPLPPTDRNTAVTLAMLPNAAYTGETTVYYDRLSLAKAWLNAPLVGALAIPVDNETSVHELIPKLYQRLGAKFLPSDLINAPLELAGHVGTLKLRAAPGSLSWIGSVEIGVYHTSRPNEFPIIYPGKLWTADDAKAAAVTSPAMVTKYPVGPLSYRWDYSSQFAVLKDIVVGLTTPLSTTESAALATALKAVDGQPWVSTTSVVAYNVHTGYVYYNGKIADYPAWLTTHAAYPLFDDNGHLDIGVLQNPFNPDYDNALMVLLNRPWRDTGGYRAFLIVHYNDPL